MKLLKAIKNLFCGIQPERELTKREHLDAIRVRRRLEHFPRMKGSAYPLAIRTHLFKERYNLVLDAQ